MNLSIFLHDSSFETKTIFTNTNDAPIYTKRLLVHFFFWISPNLFLIFRQNLNKY
jgi:hypothetical protein